MGWTLRATCASAVGLLALFVGVACGSEPANSVGASLAGPPSRVPRVHRPAAPQACDAERLSSPPQDAVADCRSDAECTAGVNGRCRAAGLSYAQCSYDECTGDTDCGEGFCECRSEPSVAANRCVVGAECRTDDDCGGPYCSPSVRPDGCGGTSLEFQGYFCHSSRDECIDDADCDGAGAAGGATCDYDSGRKLWRCSKRSCVKD